MKTIIAGSRSIENFLHVYDAVEASGFEITEVVSGKARGVDTLGEEWAALNMLPVKPFPAIWRTADGHRDMSAGKKRNQQMAEYADALIAVWDGWSRGTEDMIKRAKRNSLRVHVHLVSRT